MASTSNQPVNPDTPPVNPDAPPVNRDPPKMYYTKPIKFLGRKTQIILQNNNGPCPLIAICNILLLGNKFNLRLDERKVSESKLIMLVAEHLLNEQVMLLQRRSEFGPILQHKDAENLANRLRVIANVIDSLSFLATGMNVNVKFDSMYGFEYTNELAVFRLLDIPVVHGWLADPQDPQIFNAFGSKFYNTVLVELTKYRDALRADTREDVGLSTEGDKASHDGQVNTSESDKHESKDETEPEKDVIKAEKASEMDTSEITAIEGELIEGFLKENSNQLTAYGLSKLKDTLQEQELCVFFQNNHLNTMVKFEGELYKLVTDIGYIDIPGVVWEKLNEIKGDTIFVNEYFKIYKPQICETQKIQYDGFLPKLFEIMSKPNKRAGQEDPALKHDQEYAKALQEQENQRITRGPKNKELACGSRPVSPKNSLSGFNVSPKANFSVWPWKRSSALNRRQSKKSGKEKLKEKRNMM